mmetsp:Transcript_75857/g.205123  ORF Transcript_75857/g.205123 Transcript_75857/m.205123 type:complete len:233 (-) Transcript_75857:46-744(-)
MVAMPSWTKRRIRRRSRALSSPQGPPTARVASGSRKSMCENSSQPIMSRGGLGVSHGRHVSRSRRSSQTWVAPCPGNMCAAVCRVLCSGETRTRAGAGRPEEALVSSSSSVLESAACALPASESAASRSPSAVRHAFLAASTAAFQASEPLSRPWASALTEAAFRAFCSSMLCSASPCLTRNRVLTITIDAAASGSEHWWAWRPLTPPRGVATSAAGACEAKSVADMPGLAQ